MQTLTKTSWCGYVNVKISFKAKNNSRDNEGHFIMRKGLFHMEGNRLFKAKISTKKRNLSICNHNGEFSHTSYQMKRADEKSVRK